MYSIQLMFLVLLVASAHLVYRVWSPASLRSFFGQPYKSFLTTHR